MSDTGKPALRRGPEKGKPQKPKLSNQYTNDDGTFNIEKFKIFIRSQLNEDGRESDPKTSAKNIMVALRWYFWITKQINVITPELKKRGKINFWRNKIIELDQDQTLVSQLPSRMKKLFGLSAGSSSSAAAAAGSSAAAAAGSSAPIELTEEEEDDNDLTATEQDDDEEKDDEQLIAEEGQAGAVAAAGAPEPATVRTGSLRASSAAVPAGGGGPDQSQEVIGLGDPRMAELFPAQVFPGEEERKGGDEPPQRPPQREAVAPRGDAPPQREAVAPRGDAPGMSTSGQSMPIKPSEADILTPSELGQSAKSLEEYIKKKPNMKTVKMVNDIGGFKSYLELKNKFKLKNTYKAELVSEELKINPSNYNNLELGVLYNSYLMNKFEIKELAGFRVGAVIDLKSLMGRQFTLKDLLSVGATPGMGSVSALPSAPAPSAPPSGDATAPGPVQRVELSGKETEPQITEVGEQKRILQPGYIAQRVINPDASIDSLLKNFKSKTAPQMSGGMRTAEDIKGNIVTYQPNVISRKKKLHFWDRN